MFSFCIVALALAGVAIGAGVTRQSADNAKSCSDHCGDCAATCCAAHKECCTGGKLCCPAEDCCCKAHKACCDKAAQPAEKVTAAIAPVKTCCQQAAAK
jgi:hypothetical protein